MPQLSQRSVLDLKPTLSARMVSDGGTGLNVKIEPTGTKTFVWRARVGGKLRKVTIGRAHAMTVEDARTVALSLTNAARQGRDPQLEAQQLKAKVRLTVADAWALYDAKIVDRQKSALEKRRIYRVDVEPALSLSSINAITSDVIDPDGRFDVARAVMAERGSYVEDC